MTNLPNTNWCATTTLANEDRNVAVRGVEEAAQLIRECDSRLQPLGSRFSYPTYVTAQDGLAVHLRSEQHILASDCETITVTGDCTLGALWDHLRDRGRTLPICPPVITEQTVAGAIGTGTHAQGTGEGLIADTVLSIDYLDATGQLRRIERAGEAFGAFQLHLGSLGLITEVTLAVAPNRDYVAHKYTTSGDDLRQNFRTWNDRSEHVKAWWFTEEDRVHVWEVSPADSGAPIDPSATTHADLNPVLQATQERMGAELRSDDRTIAPQRTVGRFYDYADTTGDLVEIFRNGIPAPQINMEVGVPLDRFRAAADDLRRVLANSAYRLHYPVILRPTGPTNAWLAAAYDRPTCWFGFVVYQREDGSVADGSVELLGEIQAALAAHEGLPHWGKYFDPLHYDFRSLPRWADFQAVRHRLDPLGRFLHPRLAPLLDAA
ncbi:D-arabinono-1,4-lactone oxidase [Granulicoccus sp. GXG6511]|uniref:D-arabinono-1,4-lactone oxidase n=1 Tax=Granulicoccus sp. GXG6511 TaxID=3381351 RepID=UPI003D7DECF5